MTERRSEKAADLAEAIHAPPTEHGRMPDPEKLLFGAEDPPPFPEGNIFPFEWRVETPKLSKLYDTARDPGWSPDKLPWDTLDVDTFSLDERYAIAYWFALLSVFDASGPAVFARAMIHTYETHAEDPIRKNFFAVQRDEMNHEEVCGRAIQAMTPGGPLGYEPETPLGKLAQNNVRWYYHNGARYWEGYKKSIGKYPMAILFTSFLMGEVASSTLFKSMHQQTTIPVFKEAFRRIGQDESRHLRFCLTLLETLLPKLSEDDKATITKQVRAGFVFLSGILYWPPEQFWELPDTFLEAHRMLEDVARGAGLGILSLDERKENWKAAFLRLKGILDPHGIEFPALPEIGVDGKSVPFDPSEIVPIF